MNYLLSMILFGVFFMGVSSGISRCFMNSTTSYSSRNLFYFLFLDKYQ